jgi:hypothetical protein
MYLFIIQISFRLYSTIEPAPAKLIYNFESASFPTIDVLIRQDPGGSGVLYIDDISLHLPLTE